MHAVVISIRRYNFDRYTKKKNKRTKKKKLRGRATASLKQQKFKIGFLFQIYITAII